MQARADAAVQTLRQLDGVEPDRIAAVGYCFGGMVVLDLARMWPPVFGLRAVASLHGILVPMSPGAGRNPDAEEAPVGPKKVLVLHASKDPLVGPEQVGLWVRLEGGCELKAGAAFFRACFIWGRGRGGGRCSGPKVVSIHF